jgi:hypothetical protein
LDTITTFSYTVSSAPTTQDHSPLLHTQRHNATVSSAQEDGWQAIHLCCQLPVHLLPLLLCNLAGPLLLECCKAGCQLLGVWGWRSAAAAAAAAAGVWPLCWCQQVAEQGLCHW